MMRFRLAMFTGMAMLAGCSDPFAPDPTRSFAAVATGGEHSCAITTDGVAFCWGRGADGELGNGDSQNRFAPTAVKTTERFKAITTGDAHTCALNDAGKAFCWGWNAFYQRGNPNDPRNTEPVPVSTTQSFISISAGAHHTCAISISNAVYCWGYNRYGQIGNGRTTTVIEPEAVAGDFRAEKISAGAWHTCALSGGAGYCWGRNDAGQLGVGSPALIVANPSVVRTSAQLTDISGGRMHSCAIDAIGTALCWGSNTHGQLGDGSVFRDGLTGSSTPTTVAALSNLATIAAGSDYTCALSKGSGRGWCWGRGESGQLANGTGGDAYIRQPVHLQPAAQHTDELLRFTSISSNGLTHACGLSEGSIYCWGLGLLGQLGADSRLQSFLPQRTR